MAGEMAERVGARIRERRLELGMKQRELADLLGSDAIDNQRISDWERGVNRPSDRYMEQLAVALKRNVAWFYSESTATATPDLSLVKPDDDRLARIEQRLDQLEIAVDHQNANLAKQTDILARIEAREKRIEKLVRVLEGVEGADVVSEPVADAEKAALAKGPPGGPELLAPSPRGQRPTQKPRRAKDARNRDQRRDAS